MAKKRRRYDTEALVTRMRTDERLRRVWMGAAAFVLCLALGFLLQQVASAPPAEPGGEEVAAAEAGDEESKDEATEAGAEEAAAEEAGEQAEGEEEEATDDEAKPAAPAPKKLVSVTLRLPRPSPIWVDGKRQGRPTKAKVLRLAPGPHEIKVKIGKQPQSLRLKIKRDTPPLIARYNVKQKKFVVNAK